MLFSVLTEAVKTLGGIWEFLPNKITVAAGHVVLNGLDVKYGPDQVLLAAAERSDTARKALLAKAAEFEASAREDIVAISGRYVPRDFRAKFGNWEIFFFADNGANAVGPNADNCQNHAERKVIALSGAPTASILESVGASRPVCLSCAAALIEAQVRCFGPLGTRVCGPEGLGFSVIRSIGVRCCDYEEPRATTLLRSWLYQTQRRSCLPAPAV